MKLQSNTWILIDFIKYKASAISPLIWYDNWKQPTISTVPGNLIVTTGAQSQCSKQGKLREMIVFYINTFQVSFKGEGFHSNLDLER